MGWRLWTGGRDTSETIDRMQVNTKNPSPVMRMGHEPELALHT